MPSPRKAGTPLQMALFAVMILAPISVLIAIPWLKQQPDNFVFLYSGVAAAITVVAAFANSILFDRQLDEWQRTNARFSAQWGWAAGAGLMALLLSLPIFREWMVSVVADLADATNPDDTLVILAFTFGFGGVVLVQGLCTTLLSIGWTYWKSRPARDQ